MKEKSILAHKWPDLGISYLWYSLLCPHFSDYFPIIFLSGHYNKCHPCRPKTASFNNKARLLWGLHQTCIECSVLDYCLKVRWVLLLPQDPKVKGFLTPDTTST